MVNAEHELSLAHQSGKAQTLVASCEAAFESLASGFVAKSVSKPIQKIYGWVDGERTLLGIAHNREQLMDVADFASTQNIVIEVCDDVIWKETFKDQEMANDANSEVIRIREKWDAKKVSPIDVEKLIKAHYVLAGIMIGIDVSPPISKYASVSSGADEILKIRGEAQDQDGLGEKFVREKLKNLCAKFGSTRSVDEFRAELRQYEARVKKGRFHDDVYVLRAHNGESNIQFMDEFSLLELLNYSLKKKQDYVHFKRKVVVGHDEDGADIMETIEHPTTMRPYELAEAIALKLALRIRHEATDVPEVRDMEWHLTRLAKWLQRRTDRPDRDGDLHETELEKLPEDRESATPHDDDDDPDYTALGIYVKSKKTGRYNLVRTFGKLVREDKWVITRKTENAWFIRPSYAYTRTKVGLREKIVTRLMSVRGKVVTTNPTKTITTRRSLWHITARHEDRWDIQLVEKTEERVAKLPPVRHVVGDVETGNGDGRYYAKTIEYEKSTEMVVVSNVAPMPMDPPVRKDWDLLIGPKSPKLFDDRRLPKVNGEFYKNYVGPSFVKLEQIGDELVPVKAGWCEMHDGRFYAEYKQNGGERKECNHCHVTKTMLNPNSWALKVKVKNTYEDPTGQGDPFVFEKWFRASLKDSQGNPNVWIDKYVNDFGKTKERIQFAEVPPCYMGEEPEFSLSMITPTFRRYINECLWTRDFMLPPMLEVVHKKGRVRGNQSEKQDARAEDIELMEALGYEPTELYDAYDGVERTASKYDRVFATLHVYLPVLHEMIPQIFRLNKLPEGFEKMALQVQCSGRRSDLVALVRECGGSIRHEYWREGQSKDDCWEPMNRFKRETEDGLEYHVNYVWE